VRAEVLGKIDVKNNSMKTAIAFLINEPKKATIEFAQEIAIKTNHEVYLVIDSNKQKHKYDGLNVYQLPDEDCGYYKNSATYKGITSLEKNPNAWDKMFHLFCGNHKVDYDFVWVFEEDVFIPDVSTIINLHDKYKGYDLVTPNNFEKKDTIKDWHWSYVLDKFDAPFYYSMVCAFGMSKNLMQQINKFADNNLTLYYHEIMLNTIAMQSGLKVQDAFELKSVVWNGDWGLDEFVLLPNNVFHPMKNIETHHNFRELIKVTKKTNFKPKNKLPNFIKELM
jgi:hypothetical protein